MKLIKPSIEYWGPTPVDLAGNLALIERAGRLCYKSEDKIRCSIRDPQEFSPDYCAEEGRWDDVNGGAARCDAGCRHHSARKFVRKLIKPDHLAMVEHSNFVVVNTDPYARTPHLEHGSFLTYKWWQGRLYIGGNLTAWYKHTINEGWPSYCTPFVDNYGELFGLGIDESYRSSEWQAVEEIPPALHRYSVKFICDRGVSHELVRHRPCSFAQESTRYVDYKGKDMEFIEPWWWDELYAAGEDDHELALEVPNMKRYYMTSMTSILEACERAYRALRNVGASPQAARAVLPNALKTEIVVTADLVEWKHIFSLRCHPTAQPDMQRVTNMAHEAFITNGVLTND